MHDVCMFACSPSWCECMACVWLFMYVCMHGVYTCMYVCMHGVCMYVCMHGMCMAVCMYVHAWHVYGCVYVCMPVCMYVCMHGMCMAVCMCVWLCVCMCACMACVWLCMYMCMHGMCMAVCMCVWLCVCICACMACVWLYVCVHDGMCTAVFIMTGTWTLTLNYHRLLIFFCRTWTLSFLFFFLYPECKQNNDTADQCLSTDNNLSQLVLISMDFMKCDTQYKSDDKIFKSDESAKIEKKILLKLTIHKIKAFDKDC